MERRYVGFVGFEMDEATGGSALDSDGELSGVFEKALLRLPQKRREIFEMSRFEGMKYQEIADKLGVNIKTVETQMTRALDFMRRNLKEFLSVTLLIINNMIHW